MHSLYHTAKRLPKEYRLVKRGLTGRLNPRLSYGPSWQTVQRQGGGLVKDQRKE